MSAPTDFPPPPPAAYAAAVPAVLFLADWRTLLDDTIRGRGLTFKRVAAWLGVEQHTFGRWRRGEVAFPTWAFLALCERFGLPQTPGELAGREARFALPAGAAAGDRFDAAAFVAGFGGLAALLPRGRGPLPPADYEVAISTTDVPVARVLGNPTLTALKLFLFRTHAPGNGGDDDAYFSLARERTRLRAFAEPLNAFREAFGRVTTREAWGERPLRSLCHQVHHLIRRRRIGPADAAEVFAQLGALVDGLCAELRGGRKPGGGRTRLYQEHLYAYLPLVALRTPTQRLGLATFDPPHYLVARHGRVGYDLVREALAHRVARGRRVGPGGTLPADALCADLRREIAEATERARVLFATTTPW